ncbi:glutaredoxin family protein [Ornithinimicrobium sp. F0845]|uniref:glutaredoxin family protein n=1 Tax=Ornithinimicrobium sp. F0845 TaxID=2926412 RepID=UPI001FF34A08|nr:glutaredoxin family protein [Ornithinimicrobium sp. F0845]MCK0113687.1 glutaredoxin family protein [Ornithinimicrobium sp. F0845]
MGWLWRGRSGTTTPQVTLIDREGCHLCEEAAAVIARVVERTGAVWDRVDVDSSPELLHKYADLVPVVLVDGREVAHWRVTDEALTSAINRRSRRRR